MLFDIFSILYIVCDLNESLIFIHPSNSLMFKLFSYYSSIKIISTKTLYHSYLTDNIINILILKIYISKNIKFLNYPLYYKVNRSKPIPFVCEMSLYLDYIIFNKVDLTRFQSLILLIKTIK